MARILCALGAVGLATSACVFDAVPPEGAILLCAADTACPDGFRCDLVSHTCTDAADAAAPTLAAATFAPAFARAGEVVTLTIEADEPLAEAATTLTFAGAADPGFAPAERESTTSARFTLLVNDDVAEGTYSLASVVLVDAGGNTADVATPGVRLVVDREPPALRNVRVSADLLAATLADTAGHDELVLDFDASEPLASITADIGDLSTDAGTLTCGPRAGSALGYACAGTLLPGAIVDGLNRATLTARDDAGNEDNAFVDVPIDAAAPFVEPGSVSVELVGPDGRPATTLLAGGTARIAFLASEPLAAPPIIALEAGASAPASVVEQGGRFYRVALELDLAGVPSGAYVVRAGLTDGVGHSSIADVPLPAPHANGLLVSDVALSQCLVPPDGCPDFDGDGHRGLTLDCEPLGAIDCDDADASMFPGAPELPGDGRDNDCAGDGDLPISEDIGVFVRAESPGGDGTRDLPFGDVTDAFAAAEAAGKRFVFLARGAFDVRAPDAVSGNEHVVAGALVGGLDPDTWAPGGVTALDFAVPPLFVTAPLLLADLAMTTPDMAFADAPGLVVRVDAELLGIEDTVVVGGDFVYLEAKGFTNVVDVDVCCGMVMHDATFTAVRSTLGDTHCIAATTTFVSSALLDTTVLESCGTTIWHSVLLGQPEDVTLFVNGGTVSIVNSALRAEAVAAIVRGQGSTFSLAGVKFDAPGGFLVDDVPATEQGRATLSDCTGVTGCLSASAVHVGDIDVGIDPLAGFPGGDGLGVDPFALSAPASLAADAAGVCSVADDEGAFDLGPREQ